MTSHIGAVSVPYCAPNSPNVFSTILLRSTTVSMTISASAGIGNPVLGPRTTLTPSPIIPPATSNSEICSGDFEAAAINKAGGAPKTIATFISLLFSRCQL